MAKRRRQHEQQRRSSSPNSSDSDTAQSCASTSSCRYDIPSWPVGWKRVRIGRKLPRLESPKHGRAISKFSGPGEPLASPGLFTGGAAQPAEAAPPPRQRYYHWQTPEQGREAPREEIQEEVRDAEADDHGSASEGCNFWWKCDASSSDRTPAQCSPWCVCCTNIAWLDRPAMFDD